MSDEIQQGRGKASPSLTCSPFEWRDEAPKNDGDYYYAGPTPDGTRDVVAIVGVVERDDALYAYLFIPPHWRGDTEEQGTVHWGQLEAWPGQWAGPPHGLCCVTANACGQSSGTD